MGVPLVGCASHRLNLALKAFLAPYEADLCDVQRLMKKLKTLSEGWCRRFDLLSRASEQVVVYNV
ncbi:hypothetical protein PPTG_18002 [Phytophthora nicotianae INRA-310]|uniref:Uncharacterized protein n=1 Tax=Phytophthora nicotianae (strain INRA-310) TaxID=761204 RepID=W2PJX9_PHYN3|nr:hypothetical protein PPTG_18002 [Phytophthora nicotianae INRA-310]ETN00559.1 hypothetical protein PPTG_18002 [Phytophthora nicotianae INRA-310]